MKVRIRNVNTGDAFSVSLDDGLHQGRTTLSGTFELELEPETAEERRRWARSINWDGGHNPTITERRSVDRSDMLIRFLETDTGRIVDHVARHPIMLQAGTYDLAVFVPFDAPDRPSTPEAWSDPGQPYPPTRLTWWTRWRLRRVGRILREQLLRVADERPSCRAHHSADDCGFELLRQIEGRP